MERSVTTGMIALLGLASAPIAQAEPAEAPIQRPEAAAESTSSTTTATTATTEPPAATTSEANAAPRAETATSVAAPADTTAAAPVVTPTATAATSAAPTGTGTGSGSGESTTAAPEATPSSAEPTTENPTSPARHYPRLVLALGPLIGPHAMGNEQCDSERAECQTKGSFFGVGAQVELRARLYRPLYLHVRGVAVSNVSTNDRIYDGLAGGGIGLGAYGRRAFARGEYLLVSAFGDNRFEPPFFDGEVAHDAWGNHAGMITAGFRQPLPRGLSAELWGGPMFGPRSVRSNPDGEPDKRMLVTFMVGLNLAWDAWK
ncbi:MAG: hypothetical protein AAGF11_07330 [Myxococcota bacterium]